MMQVVINIDDNLYVRLFDNGDDDVNDMRDACTAIRKGTPLPDCCGDLIDRDDLYNWLSNTDIYEIADALDKELKIKELPSIIESNIGETGINDIDNFPTIVGAGCEMYIEDLNEWVSGKIVKGYRFDDGIVTIETPDGKTYWCGQDRTDLYRKAER